MYFRSFAAAALMLSASTLAAQDLANPVCPPGGFVAPGVPDQTKAAQDACQQAYDLYQFMAPQLGISIVGGSTTLGQGGVLGGLPHFTLSLRGNVVRGEVPDVASFSQSTSGAQRRDLPTNSQMIGLPTVDAALGIFKGIPLALTNVGGIDLLVNAMYVPTIEKDEVSITPKENLAIGYGVRVGILQESLLVPGLSVSFMKRDLPETDIIGRLTGTTSGELRVNDFKVKTQAWRVMASKSLVLFSLHAGAGQDTYDQSAEISAQISQGAINGNVTVPDTKQKLTRTNFFGGASINLLLFKLVAEVGQVSGGEIATYNSFSGGRADRSLQYGSVGLRFGF